MRRRPHLKQTDPQDWRINLGEGNARKMVTMFLARCQREDTPFFDGFGCVMAAGGPMYLREAFLTVSRIRCHGWDWPIQIWHLGEKELPSHLRDKFSHLNVEFVDAHVVRAGRPARQLLGWELKSYMIQWSPFRHVLLLDADCVPVRDPFPLFESPEYLETGAIMWPDIQQCRQDDKAFGFIGVRKPEGYKEVESGQMMIDKERCWKALRLCRWMNDFSEFWYRYFHGDKNTFDLSFLRTETPYKLAPPCTWEGWGISQRWFDGDELFQHRMHCKRGAVGVIDDQVFSSQWAS